MRYLPTRSRHATPLRFLSHSDGAPREERFDSPADWVERVAFHLFRRGLRPGDRVALLLRNSPELVAALFADHLLGALTVPLNPALADAELHHLCEQAEPKALISDRYVNGNFALRLNSMEIRALGEEEAGEFPENRDPEQGALLCFTSGTTSRPKGVVLTHRNLRSNLDDLMRTWRWTNRDHLLLSLPLFHVHGLGVALHGWALSDCRLLMLEKFEAERVLELLTREDCTLFMGVPTMYRRLLEAWRDGVYDLSSLRLAVTGSAPMPVEMYDRCREIFGKNLVERYGMTETMMNISNPVDAPRPGSAGLPLPSVELRLVDENLEEIREPDRGGELWVRGPNVFAGYWRDPETTRQSFHDGWFRTGDLARRDADGYYYLLGRVSVDFIKSAGYRIGAREIEEALERHPAVREAAVVGLPHSDLGEIVTAFVCRHQDVDEEELLHFCRSRLTLYKCPRRIVFLDSLPRNSMGKVTKTDLKNLDLV